MTHSDPIADLLARIKNAYLARHASLSIAHSKIKEKIARVMQKEGYLKNVAVERKERRKMLILELLYKHGKPALTELKRESKPGLRKYADKNKLPRVLAGLGIAIVSTPQGVMTAQEAKKKHIGGEIICKLW